MDIGCSFYQAVRKAVQGRATNKPSEALFISDGHWSEA
jgi:hypothetical protein